MYVGEVCNSDNSALTGILGPRCVVTPMKQLVMGYFCFDFVR
jgi:hypothetical protein